MLRDDGRDQAPITGRLCAPTDSAEAFDLKKGRHAKAAESAKDARIAKLEQVVAQKDAKLAQKNEVISELMEENIAAKKASGEP